VDVTDEFAQAVGPEHSALIGKSFAQVSSELGLDPSGEIAASLTRRDTWSGKSVLWPIQSTDLRVPVDLAALPYYDRDRNFEGYRGFGIARMADIIVDQTHGERGSVQWVEDDDEADTDDTTLGDIDSGTVAEPSDTSDDPFNGEPPALYSATITPFRRLSDQPSLEPDDEADISEPGDANIGATDQVGDEADGVFDIAAGEDDQDAASENVVIRPLSESEADAFDQIAAQLRPAGSAAADNDDNAAETALAVQGLGPDALDALPLSLLIVREEEALYANEAFAALTGYETVDAINVRGLNDLFGEPAPTDSDAAALSLRHADGSAILVNSHLQRVPWMNQNALMFAFEALPDAPSAASMDSTSPAISPSDIAEENTELRAILDTATDGVITLNADGDIRSMNAAATALFGYDGDTLIGQSFSILFAHESQKRVLDYLDSMTSNGVANVLNEGLETTGREAKGGEIKLFMTLGRLASSRGFCAVLRDITAWKRNEQALEEARKQAEDASEMKSAFLAKVSHEIRTPLNAIIGFSEIMSEERFGPIGNERYTDYLEDIQKSGRYVLELVNDLLDISKIESGNEDLDFESVSLNEQVLDVIDMLRPQANRNRIIMRSGLDPDLPDVVADIRATKQIIINLLTNAVRYTPEGGQVVISTRYLNDGAVVLRIRDTGIGMSAEELEGALRPFKQVSANEGMRSSGTGLGLPLTRALVEANRAGFTIQSEPGAGTNVEINFPPPRVLAQ
ncbi:MAG: ATP-binding protein, partial [Pseudomonadota bacterium]